MDLLHERYGTAVCADAAAAAAADVVVFAVRPQDVDTVCPQVAPYLKAVSYTHLVVYKRQPMAAPTRLSQPPGSRFLLYTTLGKAIIFTCCMAMANSLLI